MNPFTRRRAALLPLLLPFAGAGCASELPVSTTFDGSAGTVTVEILGDGFVRAGGRRLPLDAVILELRQKTRTMSRDELARFVVQMRIGVGPEDGERALRAEQDLNRLLDELDIMDVGQARVL